MNSSRVPCPGVNRSLVGSCCSGASIPNDMLLLPTLSTFEALGSSNALVKLSVEFGIGIAAYFFISVFGWNLLCFHVKRPIKSSIDVVV